MHQCPKCESADIHRSRAKTRFESWRKDVTGKRPYRCHACGWRGWGVDFGPKFGDVERDLAERAVAPEPPNLTSAGLARDEETPAALNLDRLDVLEAIGDKRR